MGCLKSLSTLEYMFSSSLTNVYTTPGTPADKKWHKSAVLALPSFLTALFPHTNPNYFDARKFTPCDVVVRFSFTEALELLLVS
jgi:hypothetical protein